jgi:hypothetical protein
MEAESRLRRSRIAVLAGFLGCLVCCSVNAGDKRTQNFVVFAPTQQLAEAVGQAAEKYRRDLAIHWLGQQLPPWPAPCPIRVVAGPHLAAQGVTTYNPAPVRDFQMEVVGTPERILDSVLPHEVTHTVLATYFGRPLPRWADEGICTTVEHVSERSKHETKLREFLRSRRGIAMNQLFLMTEYPSDVLPMYAQGYSVCRFLIDQKGPQTFIQFLGDYMRHPSWTANIKKHYDYDSLRELQDFWLAWVSAGSGPVEKFAKNQPPRVQPASATDSVAGPAVQASAPGGTVSASTDLALSAPRGVGRDGTRDSSVIPIGKATALASTVSHGWYQRRRLEVQATADPSQNVTTPMVPPSVRNSGPYQSAHPQPEQRISRGGMPIGPIGSPGQPVGRF